MVLRRPHQEERWPLGKPKRLAADPPDEFLSAAAERASYQASPYHCPGPRGQPPARRARPATRCPRVWRDDEATTALRRAILNGNVSESWDNDFPRYVWHLEASVLYEARHTNGPIGTYHAYPVDAATLRGELKS
jgi:hypothetical protein